MGSDNEVDDRQYQDGSAAYDDYDRNDRAKKRKFSPDSEGESPQAKRAKAYTLFVGNLPFSITDDELKGLFYGYDFSSVRMIKDATGRPKGFAYVDFDTDAAMNNALELNGKDLGGRSVKIEVARTSGPGTKSNTLFVGSLKYSVGEDDLRTLFRDCGEIAAVRIVRDRDSDESKGFGFVEFKDMDSAEKGIELNGHELQGRPIKVSYDGGKRTDRFGGGGRGGGRGSGGGYRDRNYSGSGGRSYDRGGSDRRGGYGEGGRDYDRYDRGSYDRSSRSSRDYDDGHRSSSYHRTEDRDYTRGRDYDDSRRYSDRDYARRSYE